MSAGKAPKAKSAAARKRAAASRAEGQKKTVDFRGLTLQLPDKIPGTVLFDIADMEAGREFSGTMELIKSLVGKDQYQAIRGKVAADGLELGEVEDVLAKLVEDILNTSGLGQGE